MMSDINRTKIISSLFWKLLERGGVQGIQFIVQILLARLLLPSDYGMIAIVSIFIIIATVFVQNGFNTALIQKKQVNDTDYSSVFYLSFIVAGLLYVILYFGAPLIARFYEQAILVPVLRVLSITLFFGAFNSIQNAVIARKLQFKKLFFSSLGAIILSGIVGIVLAYKGYGVWALVAQQIVNNLLITVILWCIVPWRPRLLFSFTRVKGLFSFGWKLLVSTLIDRLYMNLRGLIIGKIYNADILGFYNRGKQFPELLVLNINGSIQSVMLPALSHHQDNRIRVKEMVRRSISMSSFIIAPIMFGLAAVAKSLIQILLTEKWLPAVPFLQIFCVSYVFWPIHTTNLQAINAVGRSDIFLKLEVIKKIIGIPILLLSIPYGVYAMALGLMFSGIISIFINAYPNKKLLNYTYKELLKDLMPSFLLSVVMGWVVYSIQWIGMSTWITLIVQVSTGVVIYIVLVKLFRLRSYYYLLNTLKDMKNKRRQKR